MCYTKTNNDFFHKRMFLINEKKWVLVLSNLSQIKLNVSILIDLPNIQFTFFRQNTFFNFKES